MKHIKRSALDQVRTLDPGKMLKDRFQAAVGPLDAGRIELIKANGNLSATRDLLLPRLISGEVEVSELDIDLGESAA